MTETAGEAKYGARTTSNRGIKVLIFLMFASFAMTTDSVGTVIPQIIRDFHLGMTAAGTLQYATMSGIGLAAITLGFLADRIGRKRTILAGLTLFCVTSGVIMLSDRFAAFIALLFVSGIGIGVFKAGALALVGDISRSTREHAATMNLIEGFFGIGAIIGPAIVALSLHNGASWKWVYLIAAALCAVLIVGTLATPVPAPQISTSRQADARDALRMLGDPLALLFAAMLTLYVGAEAAIYVWAPTYLEGFTGSFAWLAPLAVSIFFTLRAAGRFLGAWLLARLDWSQVLVIASVLIAGLFWMAIIGGRQIAIFALPATGLFMSVLYPTINSTGISCFERRRHGSIAGLLLFFTCVGAVIAPLVMAAAGDRFGTVYSMVVGAVFASLLAAIAGWNLIRQPAAARLAQRNASEYAVKDIGECVVAPIG